MTSRFLARLFGAPAPAAAAPAVPAAPVVVAPAADREALIAEAMRIRAEMRERIGVEKLRVLHRALTGRDPE